MLIGELSTEGSAKLLVDRLSYLLESKDREIARMAAVSAGLRRLKEAHRSLLHHPEEPAVIRALGRIWAQSLDAPALPRAEEIDRLTVLAVAHRQAMGPAPTLEACETMLSVMTSSELDRLPLQACRRQVRGAPPLRGSGAAARLRRGEGPPHPRGAARQSRPDPGGGDPAGSPFPLRKSSCGASSRTSGRLSGREAGRPGREAVEGLAAANRITGALSPEDDSMVSERRRATSSVVPRPVPEWSAVAVPAAAASRSASGNGEPRRRPTARPAASERRPIAAPCPRAATGRATPSLRKTATAPSPRMVTTTVFAPRAMTSRAAATDCSTPTTGCPRSPPISRVLGFTRSAPARTAAASSGPSTSMIVRTPSIRAVPMTSLRRSASIPGGRLPDRTRIFARRIWVETSLAKRSTSSLETGAPGP